MDKGNEFTLKFSNTEAELKASGKTPTPHAKRVLTCKNHPDLRWETKREFGRNIFFIGRAYDPPKYHQDFSGLVCEDITEDWQRVPECDCTVSDLIPAPEDKVMNPDLYGKDEGA